MAHYRVTRPWFGVSFGEIIERDDLPAFLKPNVEPVDDPKLIVATPEAAVEGETQPAPAATGTATTRKGATKE